MNEYHGRELQAKDAGNPIIHVYSADDEVQPHHRVVLIHLRSTAGGGAYTVDLPTRLTNIGDTIVGFVVSDVSTNAENVTFAGVTTLDAVGDTVTAMYTGAAISPIASIIA